MKDKKQFNSFLRLSAEITGYSETDLQGTGLARDYFCTFTKIIGELICKELWKRADSIWNKNYPEDEKEKAMRYELFSHPKFGPVLRSLIKLWYLGQWDELSAAWREKYGNSPHDVNFILSADSYKQGLVWDAIGAHPMGAKQPGFATWSFPPEPPDFEAK